MDDRTCSECGGSFTPYRSSQIVCSKPCSIRRNARRLREDPTAWRRDLDRQTKRRAKFATTPRFTCIECGGLFGATRTDVKFCSVECQALSKSKRYSHPETALRRTQHRRAVATRKLERAAAGTAGRSVLVAGDCRHCGSSFTVRRTGGPKPPAFCSAVCNRRHVNAEARYRRRSRLKVAFVAPVYRAKIFERDGWCCQLCDLPLERDAVVPDPNAPTIDHIIPLALGGTHEPSNVQAAHFLCNATKGDRVAA